MIVGFKFTLELIDAHQPRGAYMPQTATRNQGKTGFVKEFLNDNPQGNVKAVNEAWQAAGFEGTISPTLVSQARAQMGLAGNLRGKTKKTSAAVKSTPTSKRGRPPKETTAQVNGQPDEQSR